MILGRHRKQCGRTGDVGPKTRSHTVQTGSEAIKNSLVQLPDGVFGCPACDYSSKLKFNVNQHLLRHRIDKPFKCKMCSYQSKWEGNVRAHEKRQHYIKHPKTAAKKRQKPRVIGNVFSQVDSKGNQFQCTECDYKTNNRRLLISHRKVHSDQRPFPCTFPGCSYRTKSSHWARAHERKVHKGWVRPASLTASSGKSLPAVEPVVAAAIAPQTLPDVSGYKYNDKAPCPNCGLRVLARFLHRHMIIHTVLKPYGCSNCSYRSRWPGDVKKHEQRMHTNDPKKVKHNSKNGCKCPECDYSGKTSWHVNCHKMRMHRSDLPHRPKRRVTGSETNSRISSQCGLRNRAVKQRLACPRPPLRNHIKVCSKRKKIDEQDKNIEEAQLGEAAKEALAATHNPTEIPDHSSYI